MGVDLSLPKEQQKISMVLNLSVNQWLEKLIR
jgi:hypothetical protein